ncbi:hypothetical protein BCS42_16640 [Crenothrix sp. D3]|nr:hypothetical protein BCS42_16640 [Crenothrix sp. D3]
MTKTILVIFGSIFVNTICFADTDYELREINSNLQAIKSNQENQQQDQLLNQLIMHRLQQQERQQQKRQRQPQMLPSIQNGRLVYTPAR